MSQALYRKYRSKKFSEVVGQQHITRTLSNAIKSGRVNHAYLFTGPRGVGKTSVARILAHEVNNIKYDETKTYLDIIEIDAASNRRIDEIRDLREKVHIAPTSAKYKVYIIDEVHMLTKEAFNALLKTLEEPPGHVIFILATTEAHKLPETIVSRTQRFSFKPISKSDAIKHLKEIAKTEGVKIDDEAVELLASHGAGSFRDSISLLDQVSTGGDVKVDDVRKMLGIAPAEAIEAIGTTVDSGTPEQLLGKLEEIRLKGYHPPTIAKQLSAYYRSRLINDQADRQEVISLLKKLLAVPASQDPDQLLELILLDKLLQSALTATPVEKTPENNVKIEPDKPTAEVKPEPVKASRKSESAWDKILEALKDQHNTLYSTLRMAKAEFSGKQVLKLTFNFAFHKKRLDEAKNLEILAATAKQIVGKPVKIITVVETGGIPLKSSDKPTVDGTVENGELQTISNIFGDAEVLDS